MSKVTLSTLTAVLMLQNPAASADDVSACGNYAQTEYKTFLGERYSDARPLQPQQPGAAPDEWSVMQPGKRVRHFRVRIERIGELPRYWRLTIADPKTGQPWQHIGPHDFGSSDFVWSQRLPGHAATGELVADGDQRPFLRLSQYIRVLQEEGVIPLYSVQQLGQEKWRPLFCSESEERCENEEWKFRRWADGVGIVVLSYAQKVWSCTGFLIAPDLFVTNWHCGGTHDLAASSYWNEDVLRSMIIDFSWDGDDRGNEYGYSGRVINAGESKVGNTALDFVIFGVKPLGQRSGLPPVLRLNASGSYKAGDKLAILHHPAGMLKHITKQQCNIVDPSVPGWMNNRKGVDFTHGCDTEGGSSGAPILDSEGRVVGLHHEGFRLDPSTGNCEKKNRAVRIDRILAELPQPLRHSIANGEWQ